MSSSSGSESDSEASDSADDEESPNVRKNADVSAENSSENSAKSTPNDVNQAVKMDLYFYQTPESKEEESAEKSKQLIEEMPEATVTDS